MSTAGGKDRIAHRYETSSVVIASNQPFSAGHTISPGDMMAFAAIDRPIHHAHVVELNRERYRKKTHHRRTRKSAA